MALCSQMENAVELVLLENLIKLITSKQVAVEEGHTAKVVLGYDVADVLLPSAATTHEAADFVAFRDKDVCKVRTNETRNPRNQVSHVITYVPIS